MPAKAKDSQAIILAQPIKLCPDTLAWDIQPGEDPRAFEYFQDWLNMGNDRNVSALRTLGVAKQGKLPKGTRSSGKRTQAPSIDTLRAWHRVYLWPERLTAWLKEKARLAREIEISEQAEMMQRHAQLGRSFLSVVGIELTRWMKMIDKSQKARPDEPSLSIDDLRKVFDTAVKNERLARGTPTSIEETQGQINPVTGNASGGVMNPEGYTKEERARMFEMIMGEETPDIDNA